MLRATLAYLLLVPACALAQEIQNPILDGYVTAVRSAVSFAVDGRDVELAGEQPPSCPDADYHRLIASKRPLQPGDAVIVFGSWKKAQQLVRATAVCRVQPSVEAEVSGSAVVEAVAANTLRADGRLFRFDATTQVGTEQGTRRNLQDAQPNDWLRFKATWQPDGSYQLHSASDFKPVLTPYVQKLRSHSFRDFTAPDAAAYLDGGVRMPGLVAVGYKLPLGAALDRVQRVGASIVPAWQRSLAPTDPAYLPITFYAVQGPKLPSCIAFISGEVFIPVRLVDKLSDDADLAAILATCVADILEQQAITFRSGVQAAQGAALAGEAASLFVPGVGVVFGVPGLVGAAYTAEQRHVAEQKSARVSLDLLAEAGYSPAAAPHAEEVLEANHLPLKLGRIVSPQASYLYQQVAEREREQRSP